MRFPHLAELGLTATLALLATGCCGPFACGPMGACGPTGCSGPLALGGRGCESGCGELYVDPWINEPPACSDPCDGCGNYNGQTCGSCRPVLSGTATLWGYRYDGGCGQSGCDGFCDSCDSGCDSCGAAAADCGCGGGHVAGGIPTPAGEQILYGDPLIHDATIIEGETIIQRPGSDARQIFQPRKSIARSRPSRTF